MKIFFVRQWDVVTLAVSRTAASEYRRGILAFYYPVARMVRKRNFHKLYKALFITPDHDKVCNVSTADLLRPYERKGADCLYRTVRAISRLFFVPVCFLSVLIDSFIGNLAGLYAILRVYLGDGNGAADVLLLVYHSDYPSGKPLQSIDFQLNLIGDGDKG